MIDSEDQIRDPSGWFTGLPPPLSATIIRFPLGAAGGKGRQSPFPGAQGGR